MFLVLPTGITAFFLIIHIFRGDHKHDVGKRLRHPSGGRPLPAITDTFDPFEMLGLDRTEAGQVGVSLEDCLCQIDYLKIICRLYQKSYNNILKENISDSIVYNLRNLHWKLWTSEVSFSFKPTTYDTPFSWTLTYHIDIICAENNKSFFPWDFLNDYMCNSITWIQVVQKYCLSLFVYFSRIWI